ncbi:MAG: glycosyltransferase family 4 protein [Armatimonadota bacterium]
MAEAEVPQEESAADLCGLRLLVLTPSYFPRVGGVERHVRFVTRELVSRGVAVRIATPRWDTETPEAEIVDGVEVLRLSLDRRLGVKALAPLAEWADAVHTHDAYPFLKYYLPYRFRWPRTPVFVTFHGYEGYPIPLEAKILRRLVLRLTRGSICVGAFIPKWYGFRCDLVTHGGVDAPPERPPIGDGAVFAARLEPDTGLRHYLEALRLLREQYGLSLRLDVYGDGSLRGEAEQFAASAGLNVVFHGSVPDVMPYLIRARFAFVSGLLAMLEAMAAGSLVVATYDNPLKEDYLRLFPGARYAVISASPLETAAQLHRLLQSPAKVESVVEEAFQYARAQTWARVADLYACLYRSVMAWRKRR